MGVHGINLAAGAGIWEYTVSTWLWGREYGSTRYQPGYGGGYIVINSINLATGPGADI